VRSRSRDAVADDPGSRRRSSSSEFGRFGHHMMPASYSSPAAAGHQLGVSVVGESHMMSSLPRVQNVRLRQSQRRRSGSDSMEAEAAV
jgi:hypothetical protein